MRVFYQLACADFCYMNHIGYDAAFQVVQLLPCIDSYLVKRFIFEYGVAYEDVVSENKTKCARFYIFLVAGRIQDSSAISA